MKSTVLCLLLLAALNCHNSNCASILCPQVVNCFVAPCRFAQCSVKGAVCQDDYCGGCFARWYVGNSEVTGQCQAVQK